MNSQVNNNLEFLIQFSQNKQPIQFTQKIRAQVPQIQDQDDYYNGQENNQIHKKLWEEQMFQNIHIPEDEQKTNQDICEFMYHQLQQPQQPPEPSKLENAKQSISYIQLNQYIENILFLKFVESFTPQIHNYNQQEIPQQSEEHQKIIQMNKKNVKTDEIYDNSNPPQESQD